MLLLSAPNRSEVVGVDDRGTGFERCSAARCRDLERRGTGRVAARVWGLPAPFRKPEQLCSA
jgi:hypothetical protein